MEPLSTRCVSLSCRGLQQTDEVPSSSPPPSLLFLCFAFFNLSYLVTSGSFCVIKPNHHHSPLTLFLLPPSLSAWHGQRPNGLENSRWQKSLAPPPRPSPSEIQNKRWRRHTAPLMATLGSATKVSLNRLMHHFAFVHHDRELCVRHWSFFHPVLLSPDGCAIGRALPSRVHYPT